MEWGEEGQRKGLLNRIVAQFVIQARSADLQQLGGFQSVSRSLLQSIDNPSALCLGHSST